MNVVVIIVALVTLAVGVLESQIRNKIDIDIDGDSEISEDTEKPETPEPAETPESAETPEPQPEADRPLDEAETSTNPGELSSYFYTGATKTGETSNSLNLESSDNPQKITDWYKEKIRGSGMNVKSFVQTSTNGEILNKLAGANSELEVNIEISKAADESQVQIKVTLEQ